MGQAELKTGLHFAETSSRPIKATLKVVKIDIFSQQSLPKERVTDKKYLTKVSCNWKFMWIDTKFLKISDLEPETSDFTFNQNSSKFKED